MSRASEFEMELRCPDCASPEAALVDRRTRLECGNCGSTFIREEAFVSVADAETYAEQFRVCTCDKIRGCPQCFQRADELVGALVRDSYGAEWLVENVDEKNGFPTIGGAGFWAWVHEVTVLRPAGSDQSGSADPRQETGR
jgi:ribosomal protein S27AE